MARRDDRAFRAIRRELRRPSILITYLRESGALTIPLLFAGATASGVKRRLGLPAELPVARRLPALTPSNARTAAPLLTSF